MFKESFGMSVAAVALLLLAYHFSNWGSHSFSIVFLKTAQAMNVASADQYQDLQKICYDLKRYDCVEGAFRSQHASFEDVESLKKLALLQMRRGKEKVALRTYQQYFDNFSKEKLDAQSLFNYAKLLSSTGNKEQALEYYSKIINRNKNTFPLNAVRNKIEILVQLDRLNEAKGLIRRYRALGKDDVYVTQEMNDIEKQILNNNS